MEAFELDPLLYQSDLLFLSSLNLNICPVSVLSKFDTSKLRYYIPLMLLVLEEGITEELADFIADSMNKYLVIRITVFWLSLSEVLPQSSVLKAKLPKPSIEEIRTARFFADLVKKKLNPGVKFSFNPEDKLLDPLFGCLSMISGVKIITEFASSARPKLLEIEYSNYFSPQLIIQKSEDLRRDYFVQVMFFIFNQLWKCTKFQGGIIPYANQYLVLPACKDFGFIQVVSGMKSVERVNWLEIVWTAEKKLKLLSTAAGGFVASFIMGIRDRHRDNMMFNVESGDFLHIDFGYVFNYKTWFDANRFAIPTELKIIFDTDWNLFLDICTRSYIVLRRNANLLMHFCEKLFSLVYSDVDIVASFHNAFYPHMTEKDAAATVRQLINQGVASPKRIIKDWVHRFNK